VHAAFHHAVVALRRASSVVVCAHVRPDGDAVGSVLALTLALRENGIAAVPTLADTDGVPDTYSFLPGFGLYVPADELQAPDVFVALDTPVLSRLGVAGELAQSAKTLIVFDHHPDCCDYGTVTVSDTSAAATAQIVWRFCSALDKAPSRDVAQCCYVGMITDTGRFSYDNTSAGALRDAADMIDTGVDAADISRLVYQSRSAASLALEARVMSRLVTVNHGRVACSWVSDDDFAETGALRSESETLPDAIRVLRGIEAAVLLGQRGDEIRVNLRSKTGADVGSVARHFGGGGHRAASGFTWSGTDRDELLSQLLPLMPGGEA
jgi:bifunctional oligoribonuclease and PAP phosphatase NrnA